eukprot:63084-Alexandrium_andersonii.AAC.1
MLAQGKGSQRRALARSYFHGSGTVVPFTAPPLCSELLNFPRQPCPEVYLMALPDSSPAPRALSAAARQALP